MIVFAGAYYEVLEVLSSILKVDLVLVENKPSCKKTKAFAERKNIPVEVVTTSSELVSIWPDSVELAVVASFGLMIKNDAISKSKKIINFHPGIIQINRGRHPLPWSIVHAHQLMGVTCHSIESELFDAGSLVGQICLAIDWSASYKSNESNLRRTLVPLTHLVIGQYAKSGEIITAKWEPSKSSYYKPLDKNSLKKIVSLKRLSDYDSSSN